MATIKSFPSRFGPSTPGLPSSHDSGVTSPQVHERVSPRWRSADVGREKGGGLRPSKCFWHPETVPWERNYGLTPRRGGSSDSGYSTATPPSSHTGRCVAEKRYGPLALVDEDGFLSPSYYKSRRACSKFLVHVQRGSSTTLIPLSSFCPSVRRRALKGRHSSSYLQPIILTPKFSRTAKSQRRRHNVSRDQSGSGEPDPTPLQESFKPASFSRLWGQMVRSIWYSTSCFFDKFDSSELESTRALIPLFSDRDPLPLFKWLLNVPLSIVLENPWPKCPWPGLAEDWFSVFCPPSLLLLIRQEPHSLYTLTAAISFASTKRFMPSLSSGHLQKALDSHKATISGTPVESSPFHLRLLSDLSTSVFSCLRGVKWSLDCTFTESAAIGRVRSFGGGRSVCKEGEPFQTFELVSDSSSTSFSVSIPNGPYRDGLGQIPKLLSDSRPQAYACGVPDAMKVRVITKAHPHHNLLRPLQKMMQRTLKCLPVFSLTGQMPESENLDSLFRFAEEKSFPLWSADYSAATDQIPPNQTLAVLDALLDLLQPPQELSSDEWPLFKDYCRRSLTSNTVYYPVPGTKTYERVQQSVGQMMGNLLSFPILCLVNYSIWSMAAVEDGLFSWKDIFAGVDPTTRADLPVRINGDDLLAPLPQASSFPDHVVKVGWRLSEGKSYIHTKVGVINSAFFARDTLSGRLVEVGGLRLKGLLAHGKAQKGLPGCQFSMADSLRYSLPDYDMPTLLCSLRASRLELVNRFEAHPLLPFHLGGAGLLDAFSPKVARRLFNELNWPIEEKHVKWIFWRSTSAFSEMYGNLMEEKELLETAFIAATGSLRSSTIFAKNLDVGAFEDVSDLFYEYVAHWRSTRLRVDEYTNMSITYVKDQKRFFKQLSRRPNWKLMVASVRDTKPIFRPPSFLPGFFVPRGTSASNNGSWMAPYLTVQMLKHKALPSRLFGSVTFDLAGSNGDGGVQLRA